MPEVPLKYFLLKNTQRHKRVYRMSFIEINEQSQVEDISTPATTWRVAPLLQFRSPLATSLTGKPCCQGIYRIFKALLELSFWILKENELKRQTTFFPI